jgi:hypothetical protein
MKKGCSIPYLSYIVNETGCVIMTGEHHFIDMAIQIIYLFVPETVEPGVKLVEK